MNIQFKAIVDGIQVGKIESSRQLVWNLLLCYTDGEAGWKFEYKENRNLYEGTVTKLTFDDSSQSYFWETVSYKIIPVE
jgi:hypothetical protein